MGGDGTSEEHYHDLATGSGFEGGSEDSTTGSSSSQNEDGVVRVLSSEVLALLRIQFTVGPNSALMLNLIANLIGISC